MRGAENINALVKSGEESVAVVISEVNEQIKNDKKDDENSVEMHSPVKEFLASEKEDHAEEVFAHIF